MTHALIIDDNMIVGRAVEKCLIPLGFDSFEHVWTEDQAVNAARNRQPDLVILGDSIESGSVFDAARRISMEHEVAIVMITANSSRVRRRVPQDAAIDGPFMLHEIEDTVAIARLSI